MKKYYCKDCKKELNKDAHLHGTKRCHSCAAKFRYKNGKHPFIKLIGKHSHNYKEIDKKCKCQDCGNKISKVTYYRGKRCKSCESKRRVLLGITCQKGLNLGEKNGNWQNGISFLPYSSEFTEQLKEQIRKDNNYKCVLCNKSQEKELIDMNRKLAIHHIDYNKENCDKNNLTSLCCECNSRVNFNRNYWQEFFNNKVLSLLKKGIK